MRVIGYEGRRQTDVIVNYGAAAIELDDGRIANSCWGGGREYDDKERAELFSSSAFQPLEAFAAIDKFAQGAFVLDLPTKLANRAPYSLGENDFHARLHGVLARSFGPERSYYVFESLELVTQWLAHLHFRGFALTPYR